jgi:hypothetical protein
VQEYIISLINPGGVKFQSNIGDKQKIKNNKQRSLFKNFGMNKWEIREIKLFLFLKI